MTFKVSLDLPGDGTYLRIARRVGYTLFEDMSVIDRDITDIEFIAGELRTNVVRHAQTLDNNRFTITLEYHADKVVVVVEDKGVGLDLVRKMADHIGFCRSDPRGGEVSIGTAL